MMKECYLYDKKENNLIKCNACSHRCIIAENHAGICGVRKNVDGKLYSMVYGKAVGLHVDPMEKKPLFHFLPGSSVLSFGTCGCNFRCLFCQNWEMSQSPKEFGAIYGEDKAPEQIVALTVTTNCKAIAYTYNEPAVFIEYAHDTAKLAKQHNLKNVYVTNGYETLEALEIMAPYIDAMNIDLKSFSDKFYSEVCGARLQPVLDTIKKSYEMKKWVEITTLIIPGKNDSVKELKEIAEFIAGIDKNIPWHISRFFPMYKMMDTEATPLVTLLKAYEIGKKAGLNYVYVGNVKSDDKESTFCPQCNNLLIERDRFMTIQNNLKDGKCPKCSTAISGVFNV